MLSLLYLCWLLHLPASPFAALEKEPHTVMLRDDFVENCPLSGALKDNIDGFISYLQAHPKHHAMVIKSACEDDYKIRDERRAIWHYMHQRDSTLTDRVIYIYHDHYASRRCFKDSILFRLYRIDR